MAEIRSVRVGGIKVHRTEDGRTFLSRARAQKHAAKIEVAGAAADDDTMVADDLTTDDLITERVEELGDRAEEIEALMDAQTAAEQLGEIPSFDSFGLDIGPEGDSSEGTGSSGIPGLFESLEGPGIPGTPATEGTGPPGTPATEGTGPPGTPGGTGPPGTPGGTGRAGIQEGASYQGDPRTARTEPSPDSSSSSSAAAEPAGGEPAPAEPAPAEPAPAEPAPAEPAGETHTTTGEFTLEEDSDGGLVIDDIVVDTNRETGETTGDLRWKRGDKEGVFQFRTDSGGVMQESSGTLPPPEPGSNPDPDADIYEGDVPELDFTGGAIVVSGSLGGLVEPEETPDAPRPELPKKRDYSPTSNPPPDDDGQPEGDGGDPTPGPTVVDPFDPPDPLETGLGVGFEAVGSDGESSAEADLLASEDTDPGGGEPSPFPSGGGEGG